MAETDPGRKAMHAVLENWHAREPVLPKSVSDTGCFLDVLTVGLLMFAGLAGLLATVAGWLEEDRGDFPGAELDIEGSQSSELQARREGQDVGHGVHPAVQRGGCA